MMRGRGVAPLAGPSGRRLAVGLRALGSVAQRSLARAIVRGCFGLLMVAVASCVICRPGAQKCENLVPRSG
jgi:hypothetical protein